MSCFSCFKKNSLLKFTNQQHKDEYNRKKKNMAFIGINQPKKVYQGYSNELKSTDIINGLNSLCLCDIHIAITTIPSRLILSYINENEKILKGDTFHIFNITYKIVNEINDITQYDIYNAIQDYIFLYETIPNNTGHLIIPC
jgi:hypothetical protein